LQGTTEIYQPFQILGTRTVNLSGIEVPQVLVHWQGKLPEEATWKDTFSIGVNLEDKVVYEEGSIVGNDFGMHYN